MSATIVDADLTFQASAAMAAYRRVTLNSTFQLTYAGANERGVGVLNDPTLTAGDMASVRPFHQNGSFRAVAAGAITRKAPVFAAADGKVAASGTVLLGLALTSAMADGDYVEILPSVDAGLLVPVEHHTTSDLLTRAESGSLHTNLGATSTVTLTLPQDAVRGDYFDFALMAAQPLRIDPGAAGAIYINGAKQADDKYVWADDEAESLRLVADGNGDWVALFAVGTWSVEA